MVEIQNLTAGYGKDTVLHGITFTAEPGKITTILGQNGCGKSTLLKAIAGTLPSTGAILLDGQDAKKLSSQQRAKEIAYLSQGKNVPEITVGRLVLHGRFPYLRYPRQYRESDRRIAAEAMAQMGITHLADKPMATLSGGMRQKAYIAMALAQQSPVILMDEPTTYLDIGQQMKFAQMARDLARSGKTVILVLHDIALALRISDRILVMDTGAIRASGTGDEILASGILEQVYGIRIRSAQSPTGTQYYYEMD